MDLVAVAVDRNVVELGGAEARDGAARENEAGVKLIVAVGIGENLREAVAGENNAAIGLV